jgi:ubiquinone biosynthesis protein Coq4
VLRFAALIEEMCAPDRLDAADGELLADPGFAAVYGEGRALSVDDGALADCPPGSLGREYLRFLAHYQLPRRFFPTGAGAAVRPCVFAARRLAEIHDFVHLLGEYETSDADEVAIQSFIAGQAPVPLALFMRDAVGAPEAEADAYVHLRQLPPCVLSEVDVARGRAARAMLGVAFERELATPVTELRARFGVRPRVGVRDPSHRNTCSGAAVGPFFARGPFA